MGPKTPRSTVLTPAEEAIVVEFRRRTRLPLDDVLGCLRDTIPSLSRSALHRCLQRHSISRLPAAETAQARKRFKSYGIGSMHIDSCELRHAQGKLIMHLAIDHVSKFTFPYKIHTVLTDNSMAFADLPKNRTGPIRRFLGRQSSIVSVSSTVSNIA
jgi:hypothetical protein